MEQHKDMIAAWDKWFQRQEPFIVIRRHLDADALRQAPGVAKLTKDWLRSGAGDQIKSNVEAMCNIVPAECYEAIKHLSVEAVFGVPGGIFTDIEQAALWLQGHENHDFAKDDLRAVVAIYS